MKPETAVQRSIARERAARAGENLAPKGPRRFLAVVDDPQPVEHLAKLRELVARLRKEVTRGWRWVKYQLPREARNRRMIMAAYENDWNLLMDLLPRCECGRPVFPPRVNTRWKNIAVTFSCCDEHQHRRAIRLQKAAKANAKRERQAIAESLHQAGV